MSYFHNPNLCDYYSTGMCIYVNGRYGIFEPCQLEKLSEENKTKNMPNCLQRKVIDKMKKEDLEKKTLS